MITFDQLRNAVNKQKPETLFEGTLIALDPGETTGVCAFSTDKEKAVLVNANQLKTWPLELCVSNMSKFLDQIQPSYVVFESYQVYEWKTDTHAWSQIPTVQVIGCIKTLCIQKGIPYSSQTAQVAKGFCTDTKLEEWGYWQTGLRHARDAIRHACYYLLFGPSKNS